MSTTVLFIQQEGESHDIQENKNSIQEKDKGNSKNEIKEKFLENSYTVGPKGNSTEKRKSSLQRAVFSRKKMEAIDYLMCTF